MSQLKQIKLFDIPIYSCSPKTFNREYNKFIENKCKFFKECCYDFSGNPEEYLTYKERIANRDYWRERIWEYNQIVGYIKVYIAERSIWFDLFSGDDKKIYKFSKTKRFLSLTILNGEHFSIEKNNKDIALQIERELNHIQKHYLSKLYLDLETFKNIYLYIDYLSILMN